MRLTTENAADYVGKILHGKAPFHHWPLRVYQWDNGRYMVADRLHTAMPVPEPADKFNAIHFDYAEEAPK